MILMIMTMSRLGILIMVIIITIKADDILTFSTAIKYIMINQTPYDNHDHLCDNFENNVVIILVNSHALALSCTLKLKPG